MKKIFSALILVFTLCSSVYGASSDDVYLRQDVFDAKMEALFNRLHGEIQALSEKIDGKYEKLIARIDGDYEKLNVKIDGVYRTLDTRINDLRSDIYLGLVVLGIIAGLPSIKAIFEWSLEYKSQHKPLLTPDEVEKIRALL